MARGRRAPRLATAVAGAVVGCSTAPPVGPPPVVRVATYNASLYRDEAGALARAIARGDPQTAAVTHVLATVHPDIVLINEIDPDAVDAFADGLPYPHRFVPPSNTGVPTGFDLDRDGTTDGPADARGFGRYPGQYGMALLSRFPIEGAGCFGDVPWASLPWATLPDDPQTPAPADYYDAQVQAVLPLSSKNHCDVVVRSPLGRLHLLISHPTPPAFDGPEDRNGYRNRDEILFWKHHIDAMPPEARFVVLGDLNADPVDGETTDGIRALLTHPRVIDPKPKSKGAAAVAREQEKANTGHRGEPALDTADFDDDAVGNLRVDYALPSRTLAVLASGVHWPVPVPTPGSAPAETTDPSDHHLVWVDVRVP